LVAVALAGRAAVPVGIGAAFVIGSFSLYVAASRRAGRTTGVTLPPPPDLTTVAYSTHIILVCIDEPLFILDAGGRVLFANRASHLMVGGDVERKRISAVLRTPEVLEGVERILAGGESESIPFTALVPVQRHYEAHLVRTRDRLVVLRIRDLTAL